MKKTKMTNFNDAKLLDVAMKYDKFSSFWFGSWESNSDSSNTDYPTQFVAENYVKSWYSIRGKISGQSTGCFNEVGYTVKNRTSRNTNDGNECSI